MPHPSQLNRRAGGKKGPRQVNSKRQPKMTLRPVPAREPAPREDDDGAYADEDDEEYEDGPTYGYREALRGERRPLVGLKVSVSGCDGRKEDLLALVEQYGAERHGGLQEDTTHLVTDTPLGKKYDVALQRRMHVMKPEWLLAVQDAYISGENPDYQSIELAHVMPPLAGVVACMTGFAKGEYKEKLKALLLANGAKLAVKLDNKVTHLLVASPSSPHSQTPTSDKLLHVRKNSHLLNANLVVVWEGWAREAIKYGGIRSGRTLAWRYKEGGREPQEDVSWEVDVAPPRCLPSTSRSGPSASTSRLDRAGSTGIGGTTERTLVPLPGTYQPRKSFKGYNTALLDDLDAADHPPSTAAPAAPFDLAHGKVLKKRRRILAADSASQLLPTVPQAPHPVQDDSQALLEAFGASQHPPAANAGDASRYADADTTGLQSVAELLEAHAAGKEPPGEMALQLIPGQVEMQLVPKGKSVIKALSSSRQGSFVHDARAGAPRRLEAAAAAAKRGGIEPLAEEHGAGGADDSAFFDIVRVQGAKPKSADQVEEPSTQSSPSSNGTVYLPIFEGMTFALMALTGPRIDAVRRVIRKCSGVYIDNANDEELANADFVIVDYVDPPAHFAHSADPRIRTVCWIELCIYNDAVLDPADGLLLRPIAHTCPVPGLEDVRVHFSGFGADDHPVMHHFRRYCGAIGAVYSAYMDRSTTHLVVQAFEEDPSLCADDLDAAEFPKVAKAREWGLTICSLTALREQVQIAAEEVEGLGSPAATGQKWRGKGRAREVRDITNELDAEDDGMQGPLADCVVFFSTKIDVDRQRLALTVQDLGGVAARQYSESVTHFVYAGAKPTESFKDFKLARADGTHIVHPRWIEECGRTASRASEKDFPHTFNAKKGGQLLDAGMSLHAVPLSPRSSPSMPCEGSREGALARSPSKLSLAQADGSPPASPTGLPSKQAHCAEQPEEFGALEDPKLSRLSPTPARRRRSDSSATEIADATDLGAGGALAGPAEPLLFAQDANAASSPRAPHPRSAASQPDTSSDFDLPPLRSQARPPPAADELSKNMLRQQTSVLLAQLSEAAVPGAEKPSRTRSRTALGRGKSSGTISLTTTKQPSPPAEPDTSAPSAARRFPGQAYPLEPSQATQDESLYVVYDNVAEAAAREQIRRALAGDGEAPPPADFQDPVGTRTRRARARR